MKSPYRHRPFRTKAFSLIEVVIALGICTFALVAIMGLLLAGMQTSHGSEDELQASNLASLIISSCRGNPLSTNANPAIPPSALTNAFAVVYTNDYVALDGTLTTMTTNAAYGITCWAGTNALTGPNVAQVYLSLRWPVLANPTNSAVHSYEVATYISIH